MQQYKMAFLDKMTFVITVRDFDAADDIAALAHAYTLCTTQMIAVTQAKRRVGEVAEGSLIGGETANAWVVETSLRSTGDGGHTQRPTAPPSGVTHDLE